MRLYLIRHGKAKRQSDSGRDEDRQLKKRGRRQAEYLAERLADGKDPPALLIHSGLARARQTAEPIAAALDLETQTDACLAEFGDAEPVLGLIERRWREGPLALIGHNPQLSEVAARLAGDGSGHDLRLRTGEAIVFDGAAPGQRGDARVVQRIRSPQ